LPENFSNKKMVNESKAINESESESGSENVWIKNLRKEVDKDIHGTRLEYFVKCPQILLDIFKVKEKDYVLAYCLYNVLLANLFMIGILPIFYYDYIHWSWLLILNIIKTALVGAPRFILALHASTHSPCLSPKWFNSFLTEYFLCFCHGIVPGMYRLHHVIMHHKENNICPRDLSSTMPYQRDNIFHFLHYYFKFQVSLLFELPYWCYKKRLYKRCLTSIICEVLYFSFFYISYQIKPSISMIMIIIPNIVQSIALMFGNWSQHQFINPNDYDNDYSLTTNVIGSKYNMMAFNDGYHIIHHKYPYLHFKQLPLKFINNELKEHQKYNSINFKNIDQFVIGVCTHIGAYNTLYNNFLPITQEQYKWTINDFINELKRRLKPINQSIINGHKKES